MKVVKIALVIVLILISIPLMVGIFVDQDYSVVREVTIDRPKDEVYEYVRLLKNQENFSS